MSRSRPHNAPENWKLTQALKKAHEGPRTYVPVNERKKAEHVGRLTPPHANKKIKVSLPKLRCLDSDP
jgi:hypothetical protein